MRIWRRWRSTQREDCSADHDFLRFGGIQLINPLAA
jgi:hypothetical protein